MSLKRGSIVLIHFPFTDLSGYKIRPGLVIRNDSEKDIIVVFITSALPQSVSSTEFIVSEKYSYFKQTGLKRDSIIRCTKIMTLSKSLLLGDLGKLPEQIMDSEIDKRLEIALSLKDTINNVNS